MVLKDNKEVSDILDGFGELVRKLIKENEILISQRDFYRSQVDKMNNKYYKNITNFRKM